MFGGLIMGDKFAHSEPHRKPFVRSLRDDLGALISHTANMATDNTFGATLRAHRKIQGWTQDRLAEEAGTSKGYISDLESGKRPMPPGATVERIAKAFKVTVRDLVAGPGEDVDRVKPMVRVIGRVGADASGAVIMTTAHDSWGMAPLPPGATSKAVALEVSGHSMNTFAEDGALIYFEDQQTPPSPSLYGAVCAVETEDGRVLVKRLKRGSAPDLYNLESDFGPVIEDARLVWAAEIIAIVPPRQARRIIVRS